MQLTETTQIDNFIFEVTVIDPITDLIAKIENNEFRDCDIDWLNNQLEKYTGLALKILGKKVNLDKAVSGVMNDIIRLRFLGYFKTLLGFFKNYQ